MSQRPVLALVFVATLVALFGPGVADHIRASADRFTYNDDARQQVAPFLLESAATDGVDFTTRYFLDCMPRGYTALYRSARNFTDPRALGKALPWVLFAVLLLCTGLAAHDLGGTAAMWGSLALCLSSQILFERMTGGLPRSFAFPLVAIIALGLVRGRPLWVAAATTGGALFYYSIAVLGGLVLGIQLLVAPRIWRRDPVPATARRRWALLAATAVVVLAVATPSLLAVQPWGRALTPADADVFPEAGPGGRFSGVDLPGDRAFDRHLTLTTSATFLGDPEWAFLRPIREAASQHDDVFGWAMFGAVLLVSIPLARRSAGMRRLLALPLAAVLGYLLAKLFLPRLHLPGRYLAYGLPLFCMLVLPAGARASMAALRGGHDGRWGAFAAIVVPLAVILLAGGRGPGRPGFTYTVEGDARAIVEEVAALPADVLVAGWPRGPVANVPYLAARPILLSHETHLPIHEVYAREQRRRMGALLAAWTADGPEPLRALRDTFGVTHVIVDRRTWEAPPWYFAPYAEQIQEAWATLPAEPELLRLALASPADWHGPWLLLDLDRALAGAPRPADP